MDGEFLTPEQLCARYQGSPGEKTLANWRSSGTGPAFVKVGRQVLYRVRDVEAWEMARRNDFGASGVQ